MRILSSISAKTTAILPLVLAGLLPVVSLVGVVTMPHHVVVGRPTSDRDANDISIATDPRDEAATNQQADVGFEDGPLDEGPRRGAEPAHVNPELETSESAPDVDGGDSGAPGKSEEAPGHPTTPGQGEGRGQEKADGSGQGPSKQTDRSIPGRD